MGKGPVRRTGRTFDQVGIDADEGIHAKFGFL